MGWSAVRTGKGKEGSKDWSGKGGLVAVRTGKGKVGCWAVRTGQ